MQGKPPWRHRPWRKPGVLPVERAAREVAERVELEAALKAEEAERQAPLEAEQKASATPAMPHARQPKKRRRRRPPNPLAACSVLASSLAAQFVINPPTFDAALETVPRLR
jgi:hypothetical protein